jgi:hypothetical protein
MTSSLAEELEAFSAGEELQALPAPLFWKRVCEALHEKLLVLASRLNVVTMFKVKI